MRRRSYLRSTCAGGRHSRERPLRTAAFGSETPRVNFTEAGASRLLRLWGMHRITQHSDSANTDFDSVSGNDGSHAGGRSGGNNIARVESHHARDPADQKCARINHQRSITGLPDRTIHASLDKDIGWIKLGFDMRPNRAERIEAFTAGKLHVTLLDVAGSDVVETRIAENEGQGIIGIAELRAATANDDGQLTFMFNALRIGSESDWLAVTDDRRRRLEKHQRLFGDFVAKFGGMRRVVAADTHDFAGLYRPGKAYRGKRPRAGRLCPLQPWGAGYFAYLIFVQNAVTW